MAEVAILGAVVAMVIGVLGLILGVIALVRLSNMGYRLEEMDRRWRQSTRPPRISDLADASSPGEERPAPPGPSAEPEPAQHAGAPARPRPLAPIGRPTPPPQPPQPPAPVSQPQAPAEPSPPAAAKDAPEEAAGAAQPLEEAARPTRSISWEERLGTRLFVWIGAVALALGGIWLAVYMFENAIVGPTTRTIAGAAVGLVLIGAGFWLKKRSHHVAGALVAAGVADLFGWLFAAVHMYELIGPSVGFMLMVIVTVGAVALSLRHGQLVALLGLAGGFATPLVMNVGQANTPALFGYLFLLQLGLIVVTRRRGWWLLAALTLLGVAGWSVGWLIAMANHLVDADQGIWLGLFLLGATGTMISSAQHQIDRSTWGPRIGRSLVWAATSLSLLLVAALIGVDRFDLIQWAFLGVLGLGCLVLVRLDERYRGLEWFGWGLIVAMLAYWGAFDRPTEWRYGLVLGVFAAAYFVAGYLGAFGSARPGGWMTVAVSSLLVGLVLGWVVLGADALAAPLDWWMVGATGALLCALAGVPWYRRRSRPDGAEGALGALAVGLTLCVSLAAAMELEAGSLGVAWAIELPLLALAWRWLRLGALRVLAWLLGTAIVMQLLINPQMLSQQIGHWLILNQLLVLYGIPAVAVALAGWWFRYEPGRPISAACTALAGALTLVLITLQIAHGFNLFGGQIGEAAGGIIAIGDLLEIQWLGQLASDAIAWLLLGAAGLAVGLHRRYKPLHLTAQVISGLGVGLFLLGLMGIANPLWYRWSADGWPVLNVFAYGYGLPTLAVAGTAWVYHRLTCPTWARAYATLAAIGLFVTTILLIRQGFVDGPTMTLIAEPPTLVEWATHAWVVMAIGLIGLVPAGRTGGKPVRLAGLSFCLGGLGILVVGPGLWANPLVSKHLVGAMPILNGLIYAYGLPTLLAAGAAWLCRRQNRPDFAAFFAVASIVILFGLVNLQIRQVFVGADLRLTTTPIGKTEGYAYSAAWVLFGLGALVGGIIGRSSVGRWASLVVMLLAVGKVFAWDTRQLDQLLRVFSFMGLGLSLLLLAFLYQRFVFRREPAAR